MKGPSQHDLTQRGYAPGSLQPWLMGLLVISGTALGSCNRTEAPLAIQQGELRQYECSNGEALTVRFNEDVAIADLPNQPNIALVPIESEFGEKYSDGSLTLQTKGQVASIETNGQPTLANCKLIESTDDADAVFADLKPSDNAVFSDRCEVYPNGAQAATTEVPCYFAQGRRYLYIEREDGVTYTFQPSGEQSGTYLDAAGNEVYRQAGLGDRGHIYKLSQETLYVYWGTDEPTASTISPADREAATRYIPQTAVTVLDDGKITLQIADGDFTFDSVLESGETGFSGSANNVRVTLTPSTGNITVVQSDTEEPLYEYTISPLDLKTPASAEAETSSTCNSTTESC